MELKDKIVLVTGGGSGIGLGIATAFAAEGCHVFITGRTEETLKKAAESISGSGTIQYKTCDVSNRDDVKQAFDLVKNSKGDPDILVNSAGINVPKRQFKDVDPADWDKVMGVNATGVFNCIHAALPGMRAKGEGFIVNINSVSGIHTILFGGLQYCASKYAAASVGTFTNLEEAQNGIRVTNIYPGETNTPILEKRAVVPPPEKRAQMLHPEDIAACVITIAKLPKRAVVTDLVITPPYLILS